MRSETTSERSTSPSTPAPAPAPRMPLDGVELEPPGSAASLQSRSRSAPGSACQHQSNAAPSVPWRPAPARAIADRSRSSSRSSVSRSSTLVRAAASSSASGRPSSRCADPCHHLGVGGRRRACRRSRNSRSAATGPSGARSCTVSSDPPSGVREVASTTRLGTRVSRARDHGRGRWADEVAVVQQQEMGMRAERERGRRDEVERTRVAQARPHGRSHAATSDSAVCSSSTTIGVRNERDATSSARRVFAAPRRPDDGDPAGATQQPVEVGHLAVAPDEAVVRHRNDRRLAAGARALIRSARVSASSLRRSAAMWLSTVRWEMWKSRAISALPEAAPDSVEHLELALGQRPRTAMTRPHDNPDRASPSNPCDARMPCDAPWREGCPVTTDKDTEMTITIDDADAQLKQRHRAMWASGDYPRLAEEVIAELGPTLADAVVQRGDEVLDIGAGSGNASIPAALAGADRHRERPHAGAVRPRARAGGRAGRRHRLGDGGCRTAAIRGRILRHRHLLRRHHVRAAPPGRGQRAACASPGLAAASACSTGRRRASSAGCSRP